MKCKSLVAAGALLVLLVTGLRAQTGYQVGTARVSIEPQGTAFSLALAGYGVPREGRFTLEWKDQGLLSNEHPLWKQIGKGRKQAMKSVNFGLGQELLPPGLLSLLRHQGQIYALTADNTLLKYQPRNREKWLLVACRNGTTYQQDIREMVIVRGSLYGVGKDNHLYLAAHSSTNDLFVSALAVKKDKQTVVMIGMDVCGINSSFIDPIKQYLFKTLKIPPAAILINASHTHFAPVVQDWSTWGPASQHPDSTYLNTVVRAAIIDATRKAIKAMAPSTLHFGRGKTAIGLNRSFQGAEAPYDDDVDVVVARHKDNTGKDLLFLTGCHPVFSNSGREGVTLSANYPGIARDVLAEKTGIVNAVFLQGCGGDINPKDDNHRHTGNRLAADVLQVMNAPMKPVEGEISYYLDTLNVPVKPMSVEMVQAFKASNSNQTGNVYAEKNLRWADLMLKYHAENKMPEAMPVYIQTINIGNWKLVGLSREAVTEYSLGIKKLWPGHLVSVAGYCNDVSSYLPASRHINAGNYEGLDSFYWYGQPAAFPVSIYDLVLSRIKAQNH